MFPDMIGLDIFIGSFPNCLEHGVHPGLRISADVLVVDKIGRGGNVEGRNVGAGNLQIRFIDNNLSALRHGLEPSLVLDLPFHTQVIGRFPPHDQSVIAIPIHLEIISGIVGMGLVAATPQLGDKADASRTVSCQVDDNDLVNRSRKDFADIADSTLEIAYGGNGGVEVELTPVFLDFSGGGKFQDQVSQ